MTEGIFVIIIQQRVEALLFLRGDRGVLFMETEKVCLSCVRW